MIFVDSCHFGWTRDPALGAGSLAALRLHDLPAFHLPSPPVVEAGLAWPLAKTDPAAAATVCVNAHPWGCCGPILALSAQEADMTELSILRREQARRSTATVVFGLYMLLCVASAVAQIAHF